MRRSPSNQTFKNKNIVIIGGGLAGLSAAIEIAKYKGNATVIESQKYTGGNSAKSVSGLNGCTTAAQKRLKIHDSKEIFLADTLKAGRNENDEKLANIMVEKSDDAFKFLSEIGVELDEVNIGGGHSVPRTHCLPTPKQETEGLQVFGMRMMKTLIARVLYDDAKCVAKGASNRIKVMLFTTAKELLVNNGRVVGVKVQTQDGKEQEIKADAVILASGGFGNDHSPSDSLLTKYRPELAAYPSTNGTFADGSGIKIALKIGAQVTDMAKIQLHPTGFIDPTEPKYNTKLMCPEALRGFGAILVNKEGRRFANELSLRDNFVALIEQHCTVDPISGSKTAYLIMNDAVVDHFGRPAFEIYIKKGLAKRASNMEELCEMTGIPVENLQSTLNDHDRCFRIGKLDAFGKTNFPVQFQTNKNFYFCQTTPCVHYTFGGLKINERCQVLSGTMRPIESLFAAGEIIGGLHGAERLSGNSLLECVVFGRLAAVEAMKG